MDYIKVESVVVGGLLLYVVPNLVVSSFVEAGNVLETRDEYFVHC